MASSRSSSRGAVYQVRTRRTLLCLQQRASCLSQLARCCATRSQRRGARCSQAPPAVTPRAPGGADAETAQPQAPQTGPPPSAKSGWSGGGGADKLAAPSAGAARYGLVTPGAGRDDPARPLLDGAALSSPGSPGSAARLELEGARPAATAAPLTCACAWAAGLLARAAYQPGSARPAEWASRRRAPGAAHPWYSLLGHAACGAQSAGLAGPSGRPRRGQLGEPQSLTCSLSGCARQRFAFTPRPARRADGGRRACGCLTAKNPGRQGRPTRRTPSRWCSACTWSPSSRSRRRCCTRTRT